MDEKARQKGVTVLGTGINPGMMMDLLVVFLRLHDGGEPARCERVNSLSPLARR